MLGAEQLVLGKQQTARGCNAQVRHQGVLAATLRCMGLVTYRSGTGQRHNDTDKQFNSCPSCVAHLHVQTTPLAAPGGAAAVGVLSWADTGPLCSWASSHSI